MADPRQDLRDRILLAALPHVAFDGWTETALARGAADAGLKRQDALRAFPDGVAEAVLHLSDYADRRMLAELARLDLEGMKVRQRVSVAVRLRLEILAPWREAVRRSLSFLALSHDPAGAARATYRTVSAIWYAAGDTATDFNFYTNRGLLAGVYGATVLFWLGDQSEDCADTWAFLDRRLDDVMAIPRLKGRIGEALASLPTPFEVLRRLGLRSRGRSASS